MRFTPTEFLDSLPRLVNSVSRPLNAFFITYNPVQGYRSGERVIKNTDVKVFLQSGLRFDEFMWSLNNDRKEICTFVHKKNFESMQNLFTSNKGSIFAIVYASIHVFAEAFTCASFIKKNCQQASVFIVTCDCDVATKRSVLEKTIKSGTLDGYIVTKKCGGVSDMVDMLNSFVALVEGV